MRHLTFLILGFIAVLSAYGAPPPVIRSTGVFENKDFSGDWIAYWLRGKKIAGKTETIFRLTPEGEWNIVLDGASKKAGTFRATDKHLMLSPERKGEKEGESADTPELMAPLLDRNGFIIRAEGQPDTAVVYRRASSITPVTQDDVKGEWKLRIEDFEGKTLRFSDFGILFDGKGGYSTIKYDSRAVIPEGAETGSYELKSDEVILSNNCKDEESSWKNLRFFKVFDELMVNTPHSIVSAEKQ